MYQEYSEKEKRENPVWLLDQGGGLLPVSFTQSSG